MEETGLDAAAAAASYVRAEFVGDLEAVLQYYEFWIGAIIGVAILFFDSFRRYDAFERSHPLQVDFGSAPPSLLTTPLVYHQSLLFYFLLRVIAFTVPAVVFPMMLMVNPDLLDPLFGDFLNAPTVKAEIYGFVTTPIFPVIWAFASAGFVSLLPYVIAIEPRLRRFAQSAAFIAQSVQRRLNMVHRSQLERPREPVGEAAPDAFLREVERSDIDADRDWHALEPRWARLAQIMRMLDPSNRLGVNSRFIEAHPEPFQRLTEEFYGLRVRMRFHRTLTAELGGADDRDRRLDLLDKLSKHDPELLRDVNRALGAAEKTLAAALPTSGRLTGRSSQRLRALGFQVEEVEEDMSFGLIFVAIVIGCVAGFFGTLLSRGVTELLTALPAVAYPAGRDPLEEASGIIVYYAAMFAAVAIGALWLGAKAAGLRPDVIHPRPYFQRPLGQYVFAGAVGAVLSYLAIMLTLSIVAGLDTAGRLAGQIAIFLPSLFVTNFLVLFPIYRPSHSLRALIGEAFGLALASACVAFIVWVMFLEARNAALIAAGAAPAPAAEVLGMAIFNTLRTIFVNTSVFAAIVYMAHQIRAARALGAAERPILARPSGALPAAA